MLEGPRSSGVQLHISSLPGGRLGAQAHRFVDWLAAAGQSWWQVLPLGPPDRYGSPYRSASAFAGWPGLLASPRAKVSAAQIAALRERERYWIENWERHAGPGATAAQVRFEREWGALRSYAAAAGVRIFGDIPIYVAPQGCDHRSWPELFATGAVAGAPPDDYAATGQLWGNPLYDWPAMRRDGYRWWVQRLKRTLELFDLARIDHFRGFVAYWAVPAGAHSAAHGTWRPGPGRALFDALARSCADNVTMRHASRAGGSALPLVAEDLGVITPPVKRLRDAVGLPGMLVLQFGFDPKRPRNPHAAANHVEHRVVYVGTHDQDTARGWLESLDRERRAAVQEELQRRGLLDPRRPWWSLVRLALASPAKIAIVQAQDVLELGSEARMNVPGRAGASWRWQLPSALTPGLARRLRDATEEAGRLHPA